MEYMTTGFIVMFTLGVIQWILAFFVVIAFTSLVARVYRFIFPLDADAKTADEIYKEIEERAL